MALTPSTMLALGTEAPAFRLPDTDGRTVALEDFAGRKGLLVMFICKHCPYVKHVRAELARLGGECEAKGLGVVAIASNDLGQYPEDGPAGMKEEKESAGYSFPYLLDATQEVARAYRAACTPDLFLFDARMRLVYRGQLDDSRPGTGVPVTGKDLRAAVDAMLEGRPIDPRQKASMGCNIKWKPGHEPDYFRG
jgi:peroxiredoxin